MPRTRTMHDGEGTYVFYADRRFGRLSSDEPSYLPLAGAEWLGLVGTEDGDTANPRVHVESGDYQPLSYLNDALGWDFLQIADAIERTFDLTRP